MYIEHLYRIMIGVIISYPCIVAVICLLLVMHMDTYVIILLHPRIQCIHIQYIHLLTCFLQTKQQYLPWLENHRKSNVSFSDEKRRMLYVFLCSLESYGLGVGVSLFHLQSNTHHLVLPYQSLLAGSASCSLRYIPSISVYTVSKTLKHQGKAADDDLQCES